MDLSPSHTLGLMVQFLFFHLFLIFSFSFSEKSAMLFVPLQALAKGKDFHDQGPDCQVRANTIIVWLCVTSSQLRRGDVA